MLIDQPIFVQAEDLDDGASTGVQLPQRMYMENDIMGGPFVSHSIVDEVHNRMVVVEAFVYAPNKLKRNFMRKLEASLYTLELPKEQEEASAQQTK